MDDGVHLADVAEELVAEALAGGGAAHQARESTNSRLVGTIFADLPIRASVASRGSGTATRPTFGSMVQNG